MIIQLYNSKFTSPVIPPLFLMECQPCESKKLYKVFDGSKRKKTRRKELDDTKSVGTDDSNSVSTQFLLVAIVVIMIVRLFVCLI